MAETSIAAVELADLRVGDVIATETAADSPAMVSIDGVAKFRAKPGVCQGHKAVRIIERLAAPPSPVPIRPPHAETECIMRTPHGTCRGSIAWPIFCFVAGMSALRAGMAPSQALADDDGRPNILYIMADDHAAHAISAYGSKVNRTPQIDRLATEGMRFTQCFVTNSICTPSRACILTGKYSHINGVPVFNRFDGSQPTLAKYLQAAGYHTGMIGKWHLGSDPTGFDYWNILPGQGVYHNPVFIEMGQRQRSIKGYVTDLITRFSLEFLKHRPTDKPFFLMCHHKAPHRPWEPDARHAKMLRTSRCPSRKRSTTITPRASDAAREATMRIDQRLDPGDLKRRRPPGCPAAQLKKWKYQRYMQDYLACVAAIDDSVGPVARLPRPPPAGGQYDRDLHFRPRVLPGRS